MAIEFLTKKMTYVLMKNDIITHEESALIFDIVGVLNNAVHSNLENYKSNDFDWVFDIGLKLLDSLRTKVNNI